MISSRVLSKIDRVLRVLKNPVCKKLLSKVSDDVLFTAVVNLASLGTNDVSKLQAIVDILKSIKPEGGWAELLTNDENLDAFRQLIADLSDDKQSSYPCNDALSSI